MRNSLLAGLLALLTTTGLGAETLKIVYPLTKSVYYESFANISIRTDPQKVKKLEIYNNGNKVITINTEPKKEIYCKSVPLNIALNEITVTAVLKDGQSRKKNLELFLQKEVYEIAEEPPYGFKKIYFHNDVYEALCAKCHNMNPDKGLKTATMEFEENTNVTIDSLEILENPEESNCYTCHRKITERKNGHAPSVNFMCLTCHNGEVGENNLYEEHRSRYLAPDPIENVCFKCHDRIESIMQKNRSNHGPTNSGRCNICHNPHSSPNQFFLEKPIWNLCVTCHAEKATGKHVISSFVYSRNKGGHPTKGRPDPSRPGRELVCSSCHNPHGSQGVFLLRTKGPIAFSVCKRCHKK